MPDDAKVYFWSLRQKSLLIAMMIFQAQQVMYSFARDWSLCGYD